MGEASTPRTRAAAKQTELTTATAADVGAVAAELQRAGAAAANG